MLQILKTRKAQNTAEYAILIALVIGAVVAMQTYAQRALQGRIKDMSVYMKAETNQLGTTGQYEPYYTCTYSQSERFSNDTYNHQGSLQNAQAVTKDKLDKVLKPSSANDPDFIE